MKSGEKMNGNVRLCSFALLLIVVMAFSSGCAAKPGQNGLDAGMLVMVQPEAKTLVERFSAPMGYEKVAVAEHSFGGYLRTLPLKLHGAKVKYYNGATKNKDVYEAVVELDTGDRDLQQCADAVIRLRAEYLFKEKKYAEIHFNFTNGFTADYTKWREGYRVVVHDNTAGWVKTATYSTEYKDFRKYLDTVFAYAGTLSLAKELVPVKVEDIRIGDVFIQGGSPGHCVIVVDLALDPQTGEQVFMLAQSYMPAQDIQILKNPGNAAISPWYSVNFGDVLLTPEWVFKKEDLMRFR
jgi:hypothetical protein